MILQASGGNEFGDLLLERLADALDVSESFFFDDFAQGFGQVFERAGGVQVGASLERFLSFQLEQRADLDQNFRDFLFVHARHRKPRSSEEKMNWRRE